MTFQNPNETVTEKLLMNSLQGLVTGSIAGSLLKADYLDISTQIENDGNELLPSILVRGNQSGTVLRISVEVVEEGDVS